jgi:hypothetical protein
MPPLGCFGIIDSGYGVTRTQGRKGSPPIFLESAWVLHPRRVLLHADSRGCSSQSPLAPERGFRIDLPRVGAQPHEEGGNGIPVQGRRLRGAAILPRHPNLDIPLLGENHIPGPEKVSLRIAALRVEERPDPGSVPEVEGGLRSASNRFPRETDGGAIGWLPLLELDAEPGSILFPRSGQSPSPERARAVGARRPSPADMRPGGQPLLGGTYDTRPGGTQRKPSRGTACGNQDRSVRIRTTLTPDCRAFTNFPARVFPARVPLGSAQVQAMTGGSARAERLRPHPVVARDQVTLSGRVVPSFPFRARHPLTGSYAI